MTDETASQGCAICAEEAGLTSLYSRAGRCERHSETARPAGVVRGEVVEALWYERSGWAFTLRINAGLELDGKAMIGPVLAIREELVDEVVDGRVYLKHGELDEPKPCGVCGKPTRCIDWGFEAVLCPPCAKQEWAAYNITVAKDDPDVVVVSPNEWMKDAGPLGSAWAMVRNGACKGMPPVELTQAECEALWRVLTPPASEEE